MAYRLTNGSKPGIRGHMQKNFPWSELFSESQEAKFDYRLVEKKIDENFLGTADLEGFLKNLPQEPEYEFTSAEALDQQGATSDV